MNKAQHFLSTQALQIPLLDFITNLLLTVILAFILSSFYVRYGNSISNRKIFAKNFVPLAMVTMIVITVVKSSITLSLGLIGALSIIRFRTAIKEPEELTYLFLAIAIGLGCGANQRLMISTAFTIVLLTIWLNSFFYKSDFPSNSYLTISYAGSLDLKQAMNVLKKNCTYITLKRFDEASDFSEALFLVHFEDHSFFDKSREELKAIDSKIKISYLDSSL